MQSRNKGPGKTRLQDRFKKVTDDTSEDEFSSEVSGKDSGLESDADSDCSGHIGIEDECSVEEELFKSEDESDESGFR